MEAKKDPYTERLLKLLDWKTPREIEIAEKRSVWMNVHGFGESYKKENSFMLDDAHGE